MTATLVSSSTAGGSSITGIDNRNDYGIVSSSYSSTSRVSGTWYQNTSGYAYWAMIELNQNASYYVQIREGTTGTVRTICDGDGQGPNQIGVMVLPGYSIMATGWRLWRDVTKMQGYLMAFKIIGDSPNIHELNGEPKTFNFGDATYDWYVTTLTANTYYQNTTGAPIVVIANMNTASHYFFASHTNVGANWTTIGRGDGQQNFYLSAVIPPGNWWHALSYLGVTGGNAYICANQSLYGATKI